MPRILALDYGQKRTGVAITDPLQIIASGLTTVETPQLMDFLQNYFATEEVVQVIIGEPRRMNNEPSQIAPEIDKFILRFRQQFPQMPIRSMDERFTSKLAFQSMLDGKLSKKKRQDKGLVDEIAATILLQDFLTRKMF